MCSMDQEGEIFKPRFFDMLDCTIEAVILEVRTTHMDELSESHSKHKSMEGMRTCGIHQTYR